MNRLVISARHLQTLGRHAMMSYPEECCGVLIGRSSEGVTVVERVLSVGNEQQGDRRNRFLISPETVLAAHKEARALGLSVVGYYHSHPDGPAQPSEADREQAWPGMSYLIVSVVKRAVAEARSWRLSADRQGYEEEIVDRGMLGGSGRGAGPAMGVHKEAV